METGRGTADKVTRRKALAFAVDAPPVTLYMEIEWRFRRLFALGRFGMMLLHEIGAAWQEPIMPQVELRKESKSARCRTREASAAQRLRPSRQGFSNRRESRHAGHTDALLEEVQPLTPPKSHPISDFQVVDTATDSFRLCSRHPGKCHHCCLVRPCAFIRANTAFASTTSGARRTGPRAGRLVRRKPGRRSAVLCCR